MNLQTERYIFSPFAVTEDFLGEGHIIQGHLSSQLQYCTSLSQKLSQMRQLELGTLKILKKITC